MAQPSTLTAPLTFVPRYKEVIWGGSLIPRLKGDTVADDARVGESWEISAMPGHESVVDRGPLRGLTLPELCGRYGEALLGRRVVERYGCRFPLLVKLIDAHNDLSVQVHPDDATARRLSGPAARGKSEMWYVIDTLPGARIYSGLRDLTDEATFMRHVADGTLLDLVSAHDSAPGQFYFLPAGTIHCIGTGNLLAEIQQESDITYRLYDFDRRDADGNTRELHIEQGRQSVDFGTPSWRNTPTARVYDRSTEGAVSCDSFTADYLDLTDGMPVTVDNDGESFHILMAVDGSLTVAVPGGETLTLGMGHTALMPASVARYTLSGPAKALKIRL